MGAFDDGCFGFGSDKMEKLVYWMNLLVSVLLLVAGIVSIISFFRTITALLSNPLSFAVFIYAIICGILLFCATIGRPKRVLNSYAFLKGPRLRGLFEFFMGSLCLCAGFTGGVGGISSIFLLIAGFPAVFMSPLTYLYGKDMEDEEEDVYANNQPKGSSSAAPAVSQI